MAYLIYSLHLSPRKPAHAVRPGATKTLCGLALLGLRRIDGDLAPQFVRCRKCEAAATKPGALR